MVIKPSLIAAADKICDKLVKHKDRYIKVELTTTVPWWWIAIVHNLESGADFATYLGNRLVNSSRSILV